MKIGAYDGSISFDAGSIQRKVDRQSFLKSPIGNAAKERLVNEDWWHVDIRPEPGVAATLIFKADRLRQVYLLMKIPTDDSDEWTAENELKRQSVHDAWLHSELGKPPYKYAWGRIDSEFDQKGCVSEIIVSYEG